MQSRYDPFDGLLYHLLIFCKRMAISATVILVKGSRGTIQVALCLHQPYVSRRFSHEASPEATHEKEQRR